MNTLGILNEAQVVGGQGELGGELTIRNRRALERKLERHKVIVGSAVGLLFLTSIGLAIGGFAYVVSVPELATKDGLRYLGGGAALALLAFARGLVKDYSVAWLSLTVAQHVDDEGLARYVETVRVATTKQNAKRLKA